MQRNHWYGCGKPKFMKPEIPQMSRRLLHRVIPLLASLCFLMLGHGSVYGFQNVTFEHVYLEQGLSQSTAQCIFLDSRGLIWIGTQAGLNVYDGHTVLVFRADSEDSSSIPNDEVIALAECPSGIMWVGTRTGLCRLDLKTGNCRQSWNTRDARIRLPDSYITALAAMNDTVLWIGTQEGLKILRLSTEAYEPPEIETHPDSVLGTGHISALHMAGDGTVWVGTGNGVMFHLDGEGTVERRFDLYDTEWVGPEEDHLFSMVITTDIENRIITGIGTKGIFVLDPENGSIRPMNRRLNAFLHDGSFLVTALEYDTDDHLWIGTFGGGLFRVEERRGKYQQFTRRDGRCGPPSDHYFDLVRDPSGLLLAGSLDRGLIRIKTHDIGFLIPGCGAESGLSSGIVTAVYESSDHNVWVGLMDGVDCFDITDGTIRTYHSLTGPEGIVEIRNVCYLGETASGEIIIGGYPLGLLQMNPVTRTYRRLASTRMVGNSQQDTGFGIWIAALNEGVYHIDPHSGLETHFFENLVGGTLRGEFVFEVLAENREKVWLGTNNGLYVLNPVTRQIRCYTSTSGSGLRNHEILSMETSGDGVMWIGTAGGLHRYDTEQDKFISYTVKNGLPSDIINACESDSRGDLWLGTNNGISRYYRTEKRFENFSSADGLPNRECNQGASFYSKAGKMYFGTIDGVVVLDPESVAIRKYDPPIVINSVTYEGRIRHFLDGWSADELLILGPNTRDISLGFVGLDYHNPEGLRYRCLLEGYDSNWRDTGTVPSATYTNLPPGSYTFRVNCSNASDHWGHSEATLRLRIAPRLWERSWFSVVLITSSLGIISLAFLFRIRSIKHQRDRLQREVQSRTRELSYLASVDALTETANRRQFLLIASREFALCRKSHSPMSILMIDVDHFKRINDEYGHATGDRTLKSLADRLQDGTRREDLLGRLGGDEFAILLISMDEHSAEKMAERLRRDVESMVLTSTTGRDFSITISVGVSEMKTETSLDELVQRADAAMYQAKRLGRNNVMVASSIPA